MHAGKSNILDALCFASGINASALRVKTLRELVHAAGVLDTAAAGGSSRTEVEFAIVRGSEVASKHWVRCALNKEGTREYKINGKIKTGIQVQVTCSGC